MKHKIFILLCVVCFLLFICFLVVLNIIPENPKDKVNCLYKFTTDSYSIHPDAVIWEDAPYPAGYVNSILQDGHIKNIEVICK
jgi:hypothetical protein